MDQTLITTQKPLVTVLMPVYNGEAYLREAMKSILKQTFRNFEFLIIDDGSTDGSAQIIQSFKDPRIKYVSNGTNKGLPFSLNRGLDLAQGEYIARMDCDDISLHRRLEKQTEFMKIHPDIGVCGSWIQTIGSTKKYISRLFTDHDDIQASLLFNTSFAHPSVMLRKSVLDARHLRYDTSFTFFEEDYALWIELSKLTRLANLPKVLLKYRIHPKNVTGLNTDNRKEGVSMLRQKQLEAIGLNPTTEDMYIHNSLQPAHNETTLEFLEKEERWLINIIETNKLTYTLNSKSLSKVIYKRWKTLCGMNAKGGLEVWKRFTHSLLYLRNEEGATIDSLKLRIKCVLASRSRNKSIIESNL